MDFKEIKKGIIAAIFALPVTAGGLYFYHGERLFVEYKKNVIPTVNEALSQMSIREKSEITLEKYTELHIQACKLSNQLNDMATDGKKYHKFSDEEFVEYMYKTRPQAKEIPTSSVRATASQ